MREDTNRQSWNPSRIEAILVTIGSVSFIAQMFVTFFLYYNQYSITLALIVGWILLVLGAYLMFRPMMVLSKHGGVEEGESWMKTTTVVDKDIFGLVRHPIYTGWLVYVISLDFLSQYWITLVLSVVPAILAFQFVNSEDAANLEKFGDDYKDYQKRVPKMNFILGLARYLRRNRKDDSMG
jgi:protein-S-isoprenylcysteine O-methyltransferase Ste14